MISLSLSRIPAYLAVRIDHGRASRIANTQGIAVLRHGEFAVEGFCGRARRARQPTTPLTTYEVAAQKSNSKLGIAV